jgi:hypothetical protein
MVGVTGSIPVAPTISILQISKCTIWAAVRRRHCYVITSRRALHPLDKHIFSDGTHGHQERFLAERDANVTLSPVISEADEKIGCLLCIGNGASASFSAGGVSRAHHLSSMHGRGAEPI